MKKSIIFVVFLVLVGSLGWDNVIASSITAVIPTPSSSVTVGTVVAVNIVTNDGGFQSDPRLNSATLINQNGFDINGNIYGGAPNHLSIPLDTTGWATGTYTIRARINYYPVSEKSFTITIVPPTLTGPTAEDVQAMIDEAIIEDNVDDDNAIVAETTARAAGDAALQSQINSVKNVFNNHVHDKGSGGRDTSGPTPILP